MEFLVSQSQLEFILIEQKKDIGIEDSLKRMKSFTNNMVSKVLKLYDINLKMFLTWGTSIAGLVMPLDNFLRSGNFDLTENERFLVLCGVAFVIFFEGRRGMTKLLMKIKEKGLENPFNVALMKGYQLKDSFSDFLKSTKVVTSQFLEIVSYAFLIPIIVDIQNIASKTSDVKETAILIAERLASSGVVLLSKELLITLFRKLIKKFQ